MTQTKKRQLQLRKPPELKTRFYYRFKKNERQEEEFRTSLATLSGLLLLITGVLGLFPVTFPDLFRSAVFRLVFELVRILAVSLTITTHNSILLGFAVCKSKLAPWTPKPAFSLLLLQNCRVGCDHQQPGSKAA